MHLLSLAVDAVGDLAHRTPRLARRWASGAGGSDIVLVRIGGPDTGSGAPRFVGVATRLVAEHGLWLVVDRDATPFTLTAGGHLDASTEPTFRDGLELCLTEGARPGPIALDLSSLRFMGAVGLRAVLDMAEAIAGSRDLLLVDPPPAIGRLLSSTAVSPPLRVVHRAGAVGDVLLRPPAAVRPSVLADLAGAADARPPSPGLPDSMAG